jgi:hypothetical protein
MQLRELSQIAAKGLPVPARVIVEKLFQPSAIPEDEELGIPTAPDQGALLAEERQEGMAGPESERCTLPIQAC